MADPSLAHVLWIGGGTDTGKTTLADALAARYGLQVYHYDRSDAAHIEALAASIHAYRAFLDASLDARWVDPEPEALARFAMQSFRDRFPLVLDDLRALPASPPIVAEGFGLLPELVAPLLTSPRQAAWLVAAPEFKRASMVRRGKPSFASQTRDPQRAFDNLLARDLLLAGVVREQAARLGLALFPGHGSRSPDEMRSLLEAHFAPFLPGGGA